MNSSQIILVTGATGNQGGAVARHLLQRGISVRALVRDINKPEAQALQQAGAELVVGDFSDITSLNRAVAGVHGVFSVQGLKEGLENEILHGKAIADAAKAAGVKHFVYSSVGGAERKSGIPHFESKFKIEEHVGASGLPFTILRPVFFFYNYKRLLPNIEKGTFVEPLTPQTKLQQISEEDYGNMVCEVFERPSEFIGKEIEVASVEMNMNEIASAFSKVLGIPVAFQQIPFEIFQKQAGEENTLMFRWFQNFGYAANMDELGRIFPPRTDLETYMRNQGWGK